MQIIMYYVLEPTAVLLELAKAAGEEALVRRAVWLVRVHDRVGAEYSKDEISMAHWLLFLANLVVDHDEPASLAEMRSKCLALGFVGCWTLAETKVGGDATDLMKEARSARDFLAQRGISPS